MSVVLVVDDADGGGAQSRHRKFVENVSTAFGEFCTSWLVVPERDRGLSTVEVSVIACRAAGAALLCKATLSAADDTGRQQLAAVHRALSRLQQQSHQHGEPPAAAAGATPPPIVQALDIAHSVCRDGRASVFVASSSPRALTPAARDSLEALRGALISVRFVAAEAAAPPESGDAVPHDILGEFHNCSSTVIYNDRESWRRTMRAELRERKLTARCAPIPLLAPAAPSRRISSSHQSCTRSLLDQFANFSLSSDDAGPNASLLIGPLADVFSQVNKLEEVVIIQQAHGCIGRHAATDGLDHIGQFHRFHRVVGAGLTPFNFDVARFRVNHELQATSRLADGFAGRPFSTDDDRNAVFGYTRKRLAHGRA